MYAYSCFNDFASLRSSRQDEWMKHVVTSVILIMFEGTFSNSAIYKPTAWNE